MSFKKALVPEPEIFYPGEVDGIRKPQGKYIQGLCPFHGESHPSFSINTETGSYKCFSCGERGRDVIDFVKARYGLGFVEAAKQVGAWE